MRDADVRAVLLAELGRQHGGEADTLVIDELDLCNGSARIDVAVLNGRITAWEIKSPRDRLDRLANQVEFYGKVVDEAWLLTDQAHWAKAVDLVPDWWGVMLLVQEADGTITLEQERPARRNPGIDPAALVRLLWRAEALAALTARGHDGLARATRTQLWSTLVDTIPTSELGDLVRETVKARGNWRNPTRPVRRPARKPRFETVATLT